MDNPDYDGMAASMFICGDDAPAKQVVAQLAQELGFDVVDAGGLTVGVRPGAAGLPVGQPGVCPGGRSEYRVQAVAKMT